MVVRVLSFGDNFRAFDILVLLLQLMQESSGTLLKDQEVWKQGDRLKKARKVLCEYGDMEEQSVLETVSAYGVEL